VAVIFTGCISTNNRINSTSPTLNILQPKNGTNITGSDVKILIYTTNFSIVDNTGQPAVTGKGHVNYYLDYNAPTDRKKPAVPSNGTIWKSIANTTYTFHNVTKGSHFISIELVNNDNTPLDPPVIAKSTFRVINSSGSEGGEKNVTIYLKAKNYTFNINTIKVPASAHVIIHFKNEQLDVIYNFALYNSSAAMSPIFVGNQI
jgi:hypothetical protein